MFSKSAKRVIKQDVWEFITWWCWRRWHIYCPTYKVSHLFDQPIVQWTPIGIMEFPSKKEWDGALFHYDEAFVSPCTLNEKNCGGIKGKWTPKIRFIGGEMPNDQPTQDDKDGV